MTILLVFDNSRHQCAESVSLGMSDDYPLVGEPYSELILNMSIGFGLCSSYNSNGMAAISFVTKTEMSRSDRVIIGDHPCVMQSRHPTFRW